MISFADTTTPIIAKLFFNGVFFPTVTERACLKELCSGVPGDIDKFFPDYWYYLKCYIL